MNNISLQLELRPELPNVYGTIDYGPVASRIFKNIIRKKPSPKNFYPGLTPVFSTLSVFFSIFSASLSNSQILGTLIPRQE